MDKIAKEDPILKIFFAAIRDAFEIQLQLPTKITNVTLEKTFVADAKLGAKLQFSGTDVRGRIRITFSEKFLSGIFALVADEPEKCNQAERLTAGAEMLNIIYASARIGLNRIGFDFLPAIPEILDGSRPSGAESWAEVVRISSTNKVGEFVTEIAIAKRGKSLWAQLNRNSSS